MPVADSVYERFLDLVSEWSLEKDANAGERYRRAIEALHGYLATGTNSPEVALRAVQVLLLDPERADRRQRASVKTVARVVQGHWPGVEENPLWLQALVMAAWPVAPSGWMRALPPLLGSPLEEGGLPGRALQRTQILAFWDKARGGLEAPEAPRLATSSLSLRIPLAAGEVSALAPGNFQQLRNNRRATYQSNNFMEPVWAILTAVRQRAQSLASWHPRFRYEESAELANQFSHVANARGSSWTLNSFGAQLHSVLTALVAPMQALHAQLRTLHLQDSVGKHLAELSRRQGESITFEQFSDALIAVLEWLEAAYSQIPILDALDQALAPQQAALDHALRHLREDLQSRQELLWWGQARYCHRLKLPYRRLQAREPEQVLLHAAIEAAERARDLPVEPAAAYLCEVLHALGQDLTERRTLQDWMAAQHQAIRAARLPALSPRLAALASEDGLGLPLTFIRLNVEQAWNGALAQRAGAAVAFQIDSMNLDRGQWASWLLREALLSLALSDAEAR